MHLAVSRLSVTYETHKTSSLDAHRQCVLITHGTAATRGLTRRNPLLGGRHHTYCEWSTLPGSLATESGIAD